MGITFNGSRGGRKTPQEIAKLATEAHNKKKTAIITSVEPIEFLKVPTKDVDEELSVVDLVDAVVEVAETNEVIEEILGEVEDEGVEGNGFEASALDGLTKAELIAYATATGIKITKKLKGEILEEIIEALS